MASGTITSITENGIFLNFQVTIGSAVYVAIISKIVFDALATNLDKQNYVIGVIANSRRISRLYENIYPTLIGNVITIPD